MIFFIFNLYLKFAKATSKITYINKDVQKLDGTIISFWHEYSTFMFFLAEDFSKELKKIRVLVTEDARGDVIEKILLKRSTLAYRVSYNEKFRQSYKDLIEICKTEETVAFASDGPLGPYREPKKLLFDLSRKTQKTITNVEIEYSRAIILKKRWDSYKIPLPFTKIKFTFNYMDVVESVEEFSKKLQDKQ